MMKWLVVGCALVFLSSCQKEEPPKPQGPIEVTTMTVVEQTIPLNFNLVGVTQSSHLVDIWARVEGNLKKIEFTEGATVKKGDPLFKLNDDDFRSMVQEAQANLDRAKANLSSAQKAYNRYKPLFEQKAASQKDLDDATSQ